MIDFLKENGADGVDTYLASPLPSTEFWEYAESHNLIPEGYNFSADFYDADNPALLDKSVSREEFKKIYEEAQEKLSTFTHKRSIISVLLGPKKPRLEILKKAILNPKEILRRRII